MIKYSTRKEYHSDSHLILNLIGQDTKHQLDYILLNMLKTSVYYETIKGFHDLMTDLDLCSECIPTSPYTRLLRVLCAYHAYYIDVDHQTLIYVMMEANVETTANSSCLIILCLWLNFLNQVDHYDICAPNFCTWNIFQVRDKTWTT